MPSAPTTRDGQPWQGRKYVVGFHGSGKDDRAADRTLLRSAGAIEQYYFYGFRATAAWLDSAAVRRLRANPAVAWIDTSDAKGHPAGQASWSYVRHGFNLAHNAGFFGEGGVRVAIIGNGVECSLADITFCGTGVNITGEPNVDGGTNHETYIASILAAGVGNGIGIKGGAPYTSLHSIRATDPWYHYISCADLAEALDIAAAYWEVDADIVSLSYVWDAPCGTAVDQALGFAVSGQGAVVVAAAGNDGVGYVRYPASSPLALAVSAVTESPFRIASFSNYGPEIDIAAAGHNVKALDALGGVQVVEGTSFAVPHVVAALALLYAQKLRMYACKPSAGEATSALFDNIQYPDPPFMTDWYGAGVLDVYAALTSDWLEGQEECPHEIPNEF
jgi:subtilisin